MLLYLLSCAWWSTPRAPEPSPDAPVEPTWDNAGFSDVDALRERRIVVLRGPIDDHRANVVIAQLLFLDNADRKRPIHLHIDSPGGAVTSSMAIYDTIDQLSAPVHTRCTRRASGTAALILAHGAVGHRTAEVGATIGLADMSGPDGAPETELERWRGIIAEELAACTRQPKASVRADMLHARIFHVDEAVAYGLVDSVSYDR